MSQYKFEAEKYCENCEKYTRHNVEQSGGDPESRFCNSREECLECGYWRIGHTGTKQYPPFKD